MDNCRPINFNINPGIQKNLPKPADYEKKFPGDFQEKFSKKLKENKKLAKQLLSEAYGQAEKTFTDYENDFESNRNEIDELHTIILKEVKRQAKKPDPNWSKTYTQYPGPGEKNETSSKQKNIEKNKEENTNKVQNRLQ